MVFGHKNKRQHGCRERVVLMRLELSVEGKVITIQAEGVISVQVRDVPVQTAVPVSVPEPAVALAVPEPTVVPFQKAVPQSGSVNENGLFLKLAGLRTELAKAEQVPPYMIFNNKTLLEMVDRVPTDLQELGSISGVGESKLEKYGARFLEVIKGA